MNDLFPRAMVLGGALFGLLALQGCGAAPDGEQTGASEELVSSSAASLTGPKCGPMGSLYGDSSSVPVPSSLPATCSLGVEWDDFAAHYYTVFVCPLGTPVPTGWSTSVSSCNEILGKPVAGYEWMQAPVLLGNTRVHKPPTGCGNNCGKPPGTGGI